MTATKWYYTRLTYVVPNNAGITTNAKLVFYYGGSPASCGYSGAVAAGRQFPASVEPGSSVNGGYSTPVTGGVPLVTPAGPVTSFTAGETFQQIAINTATNAGALSFIVHSAGVRIGPSPTYLPKVVTFTSA